MLESKALIHEVILCYVGDAAPDFESVLATDAPAHKLLSTLLSNLPRSRLQDDDVVDAILDENHRVAELPIYSEIPPDDMMDMDEKAAVEAVVMSEGEFVL